MRRRLSAVLAALALAQFSLGGTVVSCPMHRVSSLATGLQGEHSAAVMNSRTADIRVTVSAPSNDRTPSCDNSAQGACVGMTSCSAVIATAESDQFAAGLRAGQIGPRVLDLPLGPNRSPEPPPPRI